MTAATRVRTPLLFSALLDDAAIFPPGNAPMSEALAQHASYENAWYAGVIGHFVCTDRRLPELIAALPRELSAPLDLALVVAGGISAVEAAVQAAASEPRLTVRTVEVPASPGDLDATIAPLDALALEMPTYLELPPNCDLEPLQGSRHRAKFRTGGVTAGSVPSSDLLARALTGAVSRAVPFKLTAGLHHATAGDGHHGFLNVLVAVHAALDGRPIEDVATVLALHDGPVLAALVDGLTLDEVRRVRKLFVSFGTCSISEPLADLVTLGLLAPVAP